MRPSTVIENVHGRKVFDSRGNPTIEVDVFTEDGFGRAAAPAGASRGIHEVVSYPEGGVEQAVKLTRELIAPELLGLDADDQETVDMVLHEIDGTQDFSKIGGNTSYAISLATASSAASAKCIPVFQQLAGAMTKELPHPLGNVIGGGKHAGGKAPDIQEFLSLPVKAESFAESLSANIKVHKEARRLIESRDGSFTGGKGDEGAWAPNLNSEDVLEILSTACATVSDQTGAEVKPCLDVAASSFWEPKKKHYDYRRDGLRRDTGEQIDYLLGLIESFNLALVEDPLHEEDFEGFAELTEKAEGCLIVGDDLFTTNRERLTKGIEMGACNAIIIKPNQIGTLTDAYDATRLAKSANYIPILSHRSGETSDTHPAHLAVAFGCPIIKTGVVGGERIVKLNELLRIEEALGPRGRIASLKIR